MSTEPYESRLDETLRVAGLPPQDHALVGSLADQIVAVQESIKLWDSPGLYENEGARSRCLSVMEAHRFHGTANLNYHQAHWDIIGSGVVDFPPFDADDPTQVSVPRVIFAANPHSVRICRGQLYDSVTGVLLSVAAKPEWLCDWGQLQPHIIKPETWTDPDTGETETVHSKPYLMTKAMGDYLIVFIVCTQCLEDLVTRSNEAGLPAPSGRDRELIDGVWRPIWSNPHKVSNAIHWKTNDHPESFLPAAYFINGIRFVIPHRHSGWREDDERTYDGWPH